MTEGARWGRGKKLTLSRSTSQAALQTLSRLRAKMPRGERHREEVGIKTRYKDRNGKIRTRWDYFSSAHPSDIEDFIKERLSTGIHYTQYDQDGNVIAEHEYKERGTLLEIRLEQTTLVKTAQGRRKGTKK